MVGWNLLLSGLFAFMTVYWIRLTEAKPHIILMVLDDVGRTDTGIYGESNIPMPRIKALAGNGVVFENFYTQTVCSPTRSALLSGRFPFRFGMQHQSTQLPGMSAGVPLDVPLIPTLLAKEGYERHAIGKWHLGYATWEHTPTKRGFQSYTGYLQAQGDYFSHVSAIPRAWGIGDALDGFDFWQDTRPYFEARGQYSVDIYRDAMENVLKGYVQRHETSTQQQENPLFIYMAHQTVHLPIQYRREEERCAHLSHHRSRQQYCNMLVELDDAIGDMVDQLKLLGLWDNTLILTMTDNGGMVKFDYDKDGFPTGGASQGSNFPLRGSKATLFDGGVRSLGFAAGGYIPKEGRGRRVHELAHVVDYSATILTLGGVLPGKREQLQLDGHDLFGLIAKQHGAKAVRDHVPINIIEGGRRYSAVRFGNHKLIVDDYLIVPAQGWFDKNGDLSEAPPKHTKGDVLLFDLQRDPEERHNIAVYNPDLVKYGQELIRNYVEGGDYMEPQDGNRLYIKALPIFHYGVWRPFMTARHWQNRFNKEKAKTSLRFRPLSSQQFDEQNGAADVMAGDDTILLR